MSWSLTVVGRAGVLAPRIAEDFKKAGGAPAGSPEDAAKNQLGEVAATLCAGMADPNAVIRINGQGSAWNQPDGKMKSIQTKFEIETIGTFVE